MRFAPPAGALALAFDAAVDVVALAFAGVVLGVVGFLDVVVDLGVVDAAFPFAVPVLPFVDATDGDLDLVVAFLPQFGVRPGLRRALGVRCALDFAFGVGDFVLAVALLVVLGDLAFCDDALPPAIGSVLGLLRTFLGAWHPVDFLAVCFVRLGCGLNMIAGACRIENVMHTD